MGRETAVVKFARVQEAAMVVGMGFATNSTIIPALVEEVHFHYLDKCRDFDTFKQHHPLT